MAPGPLITAFGDALHPGAAKRERQLLWALRIVTAGVWLAYGVACKLCGLVPRHRAIVAAVLGPDAAAPITLLIGAAETLMGLWILSRRWPWACAGCQTAAIVAMNALELCYARDLLLTPLGMVGANVLLLTLGWLLSWRTAAGRAA